MISGSSCVMPGSGGAALVVRRWCRCWCWCRCLAAGGCPCCGLASAPPQAPSCADHSSPHMDPPLRPPACCAGSTLFEELGFYYIGPVDGHNMQDLIDVMAEIKNTDTVGPVLLHVVTGEEGLRVAEARRPRRDHAPAAHCGRGVGLQGLAVWVPNDKGLL